QGSPESARQWRFSLGAWKAGALLGTFVHSAGLGQFGPNIVLRRPLRVLRAGDLEFGHIQAAVAVGADILDLRASKLEHAAPGPRFNRHAQAAQAGPAAVA